MTSASSVMDMVDSRTLEILEKRRFAHRFKRRGWLVRRALLAADFVGLFTAFLVTEVALSGRPISGDQITPQAEYGIFVASLPLWVVAAKLYGLYDRDEERTNHSTVDDFAGVFQLMTITIWLVRVVAYVAGLGRPDFLKLLVFWLLSITFVSLARSAGRAFCRRQIQYIQNTLIVGGGDTGQSLAQRILRHPEYGLNIVGFVDPSPGSHPVHSRRDLAMLGDLTDLPALVSLLDVERVIVASDGQENPGFIRDLNECGVQVDIVPRFYELIGSDVDIHMVEGMPVIGLPPFSLSRSSRFLKRSLDFMGSVIGLTVLAPLICICAIAIKLESRGPVLFRQVRVGARGSDFRILKLRTMYSDAEQRKTEFAHLNRHADTGDRRLFKIDNDPRVTRVGRLLRRTSIDELPQLWNVLRGEMSLVGPRPLIGEEHAQVRNWETKRLGLRPGMTGLWQVLGRGDIPFEEMVRLDYVYVTSWSLGHDLRLLARTLPAIARQRSGD